MKKILSLALACALLLSLPLIGSAEEELSGSIVWVTNRTDIADTVLTDMAKEFMALHPGTTVEVEGIKDVEQTMMTRMAANEMPDVSLIITTKLTKSDFANYFLPLDDLGFTADDVYFYENCVGDDGKLYGLTTDMYTNCVFYNKAAFAKAGITEVPKTLEELDATCQKLKEAGIVPFATSFRDSWPLRGWFSGFYTQIGLSGNVNFMDELVNAEKLFDDSEFGNLYTLKIARDFADKGYFEPELVAANWDNQRRDILNGRHGHVLRRRLVRPAAGIQQRYARRGRRRVPLPRRAGLTVCPSWFYGVSKTSEHPDVAKAFLKFMLEDGRYADCLKAECSLKSVQSDLPGLAELYGYGLPVIEMPTTPSKLIEIFNKGQMGLDSITQEYLIAEDPDAIIQKYNDKWTQAKKDLGL